MKQIFIASDHAGFEYKKLLLENLETSLKDKFEIKDLGPSNLDSVDYPDFADLVSKKLKNNPESFGVLICGSGQGMAIRANKYLYVRAALACSDDMVKLAREHNNANIICIGSRGCTIVEAQRWTHLFLNTPFAGGRHQTRVAKVGSDIS